MDKDEMARLARQVAGEIEPLYHGTEFLSAILQSGKLLFSFGGEPVVSFTRSAAEAGRWANIGRNEGEQRGAILVFDRATLRNRYRLEPWGYDAKHDEHEERVWLRDVDIYPHLIGIVAQPLPSRTPEARQRAHNFARRAANQRLRLETLMFQARKRGIELDVVQHIAEITAILEKHGTCAVGAQFENRDAGAPTRQEIRELRRLYIDDRIH